MHAVDRAIFTALCAVLIINRAANAASDSSLRISTRNHQMKFQLGEVIPLDLSFTAGTAERFSINMARYDRSGRMRWETFVVSPTEGTADPLAVYFKAFRGFLGGGLTNFQYLSIAPLEIHLQLNEWVRFDRPGTYHVVVISQRVSDQDSGVPQSKPIQLTSNELSLQIVSADPAWQKAELEQIRGVLRQHPPPVVVRQEDDAHTMALKWLRYLGTPDAAREMAGMFRSNDGNTEFQCMLGLVGSPSRLDGLKEMKRLLPMPDFPVDETFLSTMALLALDPNASSEDLAKRREENLDEIREELLQVLPEKTGAALAISTDAALSSKQGQPPPEAREKISKQITGAFALLPIETKTKWLEWRWDQVKGPEWIPLLRQIVGEYTDFAVPNETHAYQSLQLSGAALKDWYELDPDSARQAVITEIERPKPRFSVETLGLLPDRVLPEAEKTIAEHFVNTTDYFAEGQLAGLLFRYADSDVLPIILPKVERTIGSWACEPQKNALAYVLKVDVSSAKPLIERALAARGQTGCWNSMLMELGSMQPSSVLEQFAIEALYDPDAQLGTNAANYLGRYGSAEAEPELWRRYVDWSAVWKGRDAELRFIPAGSQAHVWDANLGQALARALAEGQGWFADEQQLRQIKFLATESIQQEIDADLREVMERPIKIQYVGSTPPDFRIAQYETHSLPELEMKLKQFPSGTSFVFSGPVQAKDASIIPDLKTWMKDTAIKISGLDSASQDGSLLRE